MRLILVRGLPGSGKSTYAKTLGLEHYEADMYFEQIGFNPALLKDAHNWCQVETYAALRRGESVVVSNTFTQRWELRPYYDIAQRCGARVEEVVMRGDYGSIHGVPAETIRCMAARWEE
jgi:predicted kinase